MKQIQKNNQCCNLSMVLDQIINNLTKSEPKFSKNSHFYLTTQIILEKVWGHWKHFQKESKICEKCEWICYF